MLLGQTIKSLREKQGYSLNELAKLIGVTKETIIKWENNIHTPRIINIVKLCKIFDISIHSFLSLCQNKSR